MRRILWVACVLGGLLVAGRPAGAGDEAALKALVAKAVKARGGADVKDKAITLRGKGTFYGLGEGIPYAGEWQIDQPDKIRVTIEGKGDATFKFTVVLNGDKGWKKLNDDAAEELDKDAVAEEQHGLYFTRVTNLAVLTREKGFTFSPVGEDKVGGRPAVGVRVSHKGRRDVTLYFDKQNHRLLKAATTVKDAQMGGQEVNQETYYGDYKKVGGVERPMRTEIKREGKRYVEAQFESAEPAERLDAAIFAKP